MNTDPDHTKPLAPTLGNQSTVPLRQVWGREQVRVSMFTVPNRRGWLALPQDVADWLFAMWTSASAKEGGDTRP